MFHFVDDKGATVHTVKVQASVCQQHPGADLFPLMCAHAIISMGQTRGCCMAHKLLCYIDSTPGLDYLRESFMDNFAGFTTFWFDG